MACLRNLLKCSVNRIWIYTPLSTPLSFSGDVTHKIINEYIYSTVLVYTRQVRWDEKKWMRFHCSSGEAGFSRSRPVSGKRPRSSSPELKITQKESPRGGGKGSGASSSRVSRRRGKQGEFSKKTCWRILPMSVSFLDPSVKEELEERTDCLIPRCVFLRNDDLPLGHVPRYEVGTKLLRNS